MVSVFNHVFNEPNDGIMVFLTNHIIPNNGFNYQRVTMVFLGETIYRTP